jgi:ubiquinone/menaquinone biosynthesis C-methylase UbiE
VGLWNDHVLPRLMDRVLRTPEVNARRAKVCGGLHGQVLEIGFGSGLNLRHYPAAVTEILVVEPSASALRLAEPRKAAVSTPVDHVGLDGARLDLPDRSVDCVLSTYTLCISGEDGWCLDVVGVRTVVGKAQPFAARHARGSE